MSEKILKLSEGNNRITLLSHIVPCTVHYYNNKAYQCSGLDSNCPFCTLLHASYFQFRKTEDEKFHKIYTSCIRQPKFYVLGYTEEKGYYVFGNTFFSEILDKYNFVIKFWDKYDFIFKTEKIKGAFQYLKVVKISKTERRDIPSENSCNPFETITEELRNELIEKNKDLIVDYTSHILKS